MSTPDPVDDLLAGLKPAEPSQSALPKAEQAFLNYAAESKKGTAGLWRTWSRWFEPALVGVFVLIFVVWAFARVFGS
jgi:hypothetical protein